MNYEHEIKKRAAKFIRSQNKSQQKRILQAIYQLPLAGDIKQMQGYSNLYRLRVGDYRVLFEINPQTSDLTVICVTAAGNRGDVYK